MPDIIFLNKQKIDWNEGEQYLKRYVGGLVEIAETGDVVYLGKDFPDEYSSSKYTRKKSIPVMLLMAGITIRQGLQCRYIIMI